MNHIRAWAARSPGGALEPYEYDAGPLRSDEVEVTVEFCGICHADRSMLNNEWGLTTYPLVPGHEVVGTVTAVGERVRGIAIGQHVGAGWNSASCMSCRTCLSGDQHLCSQLQRTIIGRHGGYAERLRVQWPWVFPLPQALDASAAGPLLCAGVAVFAPLLTLGVTATQHVGVVGIGGLGHLAIKVAKAWGCEVTAFTSKDSKREEAHRFGAHRVILGLDSESMKAITGTLDVLLITAGVSLDWKAIMATLAPKGRAHFLGVVMDPVPVDVVSLIFGQQCVSASATGSPHVIATLLDFSARHGLSPQVEHFPMSRANEALDHLKAGKARYRVVLDADFP
jgi:uncharacterized zinc-type alcohol dehydrogenase-like protein